jgi:hypothetical protein
MVKGRGGDVRYGFNECPLFGAMIGAFRTALTVLATDTW